MIDRYVADNAARIKPRLLPVALGVLHAHRVAGDNVVIATGAPPELARAISWQTFNLMARDWRLGEPFDFVFCRNVMIYFDATTQRAVLERIHRVMKPGGMLFVGHAENFSDARNLFVLRGKTVYERI